MFEKIHTDNTYLCLINGQWVPGKEHAPTAVYRPADGIAMEITAISVVPPPISTTKWPRGCIISIPAPSAAAMGSSTRYTLRAPAATTASTAASLSMPEIAAGTQTATRGFTTCEW